MIEKVPALERDNVELRSVSARSINAAGESRLPPRRKLDLQHQPHAVGNEGGLARRLQAPGVG
jgi:hypothetical protein